MIVNNCFFFQQIKSVWNLKQFFPMHLQIIFEIQWVTFVNMTSMEPATSIVF